MSLTGEQPLHLFRQPKEWEQKLLPNLMKRTPKETNENRTNQQRNAIKANRRRQFNKIQYPKVRTLHKSNKQSKNEQQSGN